MRRRWIFLGLIAGFGAVVASAVAMGWAASDEKKPVESFLPANSVLYVGWDGTAHHKEAWEKTVAYEALEKSGLVGTLTKIALSYVPVEHKADAGAIRDILKSIAQRGFSLSLSFTKGTDIPLAVLVLQDAGGLAPLIGARLPQLVGNSMKFESLTVRGRQVTRSQSTEHDGLEIAWWAEGGHLIAVFGKDSVESALDVAEGKSPAITTSANWKTYREDRAEFDPAFCGWIDVAALKTRFADHVVQAKSEKEPQITVGQLMKVFGVDRMGSVVCSYGFRDQALVSRILVEAPAPRTGLMALMDQRPISLVDLPPLAKDTTTLVACSLDWSKTYDDLVKLAHEIGDTVSVNGSAQVDSFLNQLPVLLGFDLKRGLCDPLGGVICLYNDSSAAIPGGFGFGLAIQVKDPDTLKKTLQTAFDHLQAQFPNGLTVTQDKRLDREISLLGIGPLPIHPALCVDKHWLLIGLSPQSVESSLMRIDGKLDVWKPSPAEQTALNAVPKKFQLLSLSDPRPTYTAIVTFLPFILTGIDQAMQAQGPGRPGGRTGERMALLSELPPPDVMTRSMFPNASAWTVDDRGLHGQSRESAPGLVGSGGIAVSAIAVAILLPAVQAAREAARRTQSRNNMKQIMLALHNYHDVNMAFPAGTHPNKNLKPEKRLSWLADILPFVEQDSLQKQIDFSKAWDDPANREAVAAPLNIFLNPSAVQNAKNTYGVTDYVGLAGLGADGPNLPVTSPKAGCFAYNRVTRIQDITDGTSNTAMISESSKYAGAWAAGGRPTIRSLTAQPYINGPDGLGDSHPGGCLIGLADGSVRFFSDKVDPKLMEAIVTINGGEIVNLDAGQ
jgi:type II secretory pathway pseudopilin PulG